MASSVENMKRLDRGAAWSVFGNLLNILPGLLEIFLLRKFGLGVWGEFLAAQAVVLVAGRVACMGLDKGLLWYLPNLAKRTTGLRNPALLAAAQVFVLGSILAVGIAGPLLEWVLPRASDVGLGRTVVLATPFFAASEVLIGALQGIQRFHYRPLLRDLGASAFLAPIALALAFALGMGPVSLGIGFLAGHFLVATLSVFFWWKETRDKSGGTFAPSKELGRYSVPLWIGDSVNSANQRITVLILSRVASSQVVGAFGVINMIWQVCTLPRRSFETPLVAVTAGADPHEVRDLYLQVVSKVLTWQIPVVVAIAVAGGDILRLISPALGAPEHHLGLSLLVFTSFAASAPWMAQQILAGLGHSKRLLWNASLGAIVGTSLVWFLVPRYGIVGACFAQAVAIVVSGLLGSWQILHFANLPGYPPRYLTTIAFTLVGSAAGLWIWLVSGSEIAVSRWPAWVAGASLLGLWSWLEKPWRTLRA